MTEPTREIASVAKAPAAEFLLWREVDRLDRSIAANALRIDRLDEHGSRGVDGLRAKVDQLAKDIEQHEALHQQQTEQQITGRRWVIGVTVAVVAPLYPLLGFLLTQATR